MFLRMSLRLQNRTSANTLPEIKSGHHHRHIDMRAGYNPLWGNRARAANIWILEQR